MSIYDLILYLICPFFTIHVKIMNTKIKWDKEYATSYYDEVIELKKRGIRYTWVYKNSEGLSVWKFRKDRTLWLALADIYRNKKYEF